MNSCQSLVHHTGEYFVMVVYFLFCYDPLKIVMLDKIYDIKITNPEDGIRIFQNINTIAEYIENHN